MADVAYQRAGQVRQLLAERENARIYGQTDRVAACDKQLASLGYIEEEKPAKVAKDQSPQGRSTRQQRQSTVSKPTDEDD